MSIVPTRKTYMAIITGDEDRDFSVPIFTDSKATMDITQNARDTKRVRHVARRMFFVRYCRYTGQITLYHISGKQFQLADIGTKADIDPVEFEYKLSICESPYPSEAVSLILHDLQNRRGVLESSTEDDVSPCSGVVREYIGSEKPT
jgi:hypothetical protein